MIHIRYAQIRSLDLSNGEGIGVTLFVQGCRFRCPNCFNPETWDFYGGKEWTIETKEKFLELIDKPYIKRVSILGGEPLADENLDDVLDLVTEVNKRYNTPQYIDNNNGNNHNILTNNTDEIRLSCPQKSIWLYTGYTWEEIFSKQICYKTIDNLISEDCNITTLQSRYNNSIFMKRAKIVGLCDILIDGRYIESQCDITLKWKGSKNQRVIDINKTLKQGEIVLWCS